MFFQKWKIPNFNSIERNHSCCLVLGPYFIIVSIYLYRTKKSVPVWLSVWFLPLEQVSFVLIQAPTIRYAYRLPSRYEFLIFRLIVTPLFLTVVFVQSIKARCYKSKNEDVFGAAPIGDVPTTSEWSTILVAIKVWLILEVSHYFVRNVLLAALYRPEILLDIWEQREKLHRVLECEVLTLQMIFCTKRQATLLRKNAINITDQEKRP